MERSHGPSPLLQFLFNHRFPLSHVIRAAIKAIHDGLLELLESNDRIAQMRGRRENILAQLLVRRKMLVRLLVLVKWAKKASHTLSPAFEIAKTLHELSELWKRSAFLSPYLTPGAPIKSLESMIEERSNAAWDVAASVHIMNCSSYRLLPLSIQSSIGMSQKAPHEFTKGTKDFFRTNIAMLVLSDSLLFGYDLLRFPLLDIKKHDNGLYLGFSAFQCVCSPRMGPKGGDRSIEERVFWKVDSIDISLTLSSDPSTSLCSKSQCSYLIQQANLSLSQSEDKQVLRPLYTFFSTFCVRLIFAGFCSQSREVTSKSVKCEISPFHQLKMHYWDTSGSNHVSILLTKKTNGHDLTLQHSCRDLDLSTSLQDLYNPVIDLWNILKAVQREHMAWRLRMLSSELSESLPGLGFEFLDKIVPCLSVNLLGQFYVLISIDEIDGQFSVRLSPPLDFTLAFQFTMAFREILNSEGVGSSLKKLVSKWSMFLFEVGVNDCLKLNGFRIVPTPSGFTDAKGVVFFKDHLKMGFQCVRHEGDVLLHFSYDPIDKNLQKIDSCTIQSKASTNGNSFLQRIAKSVFIK